MDKRKYDVWGGWELEDLCPDFGPEELRLAEINLAKYLELTLRIFDRISEDPIEYAKFRDELAKMKNQQNQGKSS